MIATRRQTVGAVATHAAQEEPGMAAQLRQTVTRQRWLAGRTSRRMSGRMALLALAIVGAAVSGGAGCIAVQAVVDRVARPLPLPADATGPLPAARAGDAPAGARAGQKALVLVEKTASYRHHDAIAAARPHVAQAAARAGLALVVTESVGFVHREALADVSVIILSHANGDLFSAQQRADLLEWLRAGGGLFLLHGAVGDFHAAWPDFTSTIVGARFVGHTVPPLVTATIRVRSVPHPVARALPPVFRVEDEIYAFAEPPGGPDTVILAETDPHTYAPEGLWGLWDQRRPRGQPVVWARTVGRGRVFVCALGHNPALYDDPVFADLLAAGFAWLQPGGAAGRR
jgi:type 1 glutamine amidotransferase